MKAIKIDQPIIGFEVVKPDPQPAPERPMADVVQMHEKLERPDMLSGTTYKIKTPLSDHALYVTFNDIVLNQGTEHELRRPFEMFINSKDMQQFQWVVALTRVISAVFRKGGDITFLVAELFEVFDPKGGYQRKGLLIPSLVAEIGMALQEHLQMIGILAKREKDEATQEYLNSKRDEYQAKHGADENDGGYPKGAVLCTKCNHVAALRLDGCLTCLECGDSKCG